MFLRGGAGDVFFLLSVCHGLLINGEELETRVHKPPAHCQV